MSAQRCTLMEWVVGDHSAETFQPLLGYSQQVKVLFLSYRRLDSLPSFYS